MYGRKKATAVTCCKKPRHTLGIKDETTAVRMLHSSSGSRLRHGLNLNNGRFLRGIYIYLRPEGSPSSSARPLLIPTPARVRLWFLLNAWPAEQLRPSVSCRRCGRCTCTYVRKYKAGCCRLPRMRVSLGSRLGSYPRLSVFPGIGLLSSQRFSLVQRRRLKAAHRPPLSATSLVASEASTLIRVLRMMPVRVRFLACISTAGPAATLKADVSTSLHRQCRGDHEAVVCQQGRPPHGFARIHTSRLALQHRHCTAQSWAGAGRAAAESVAYSLSTPWTKPPTYILKRV